MFRNGVTRHGHEVPSLVDRLVRVLGLEARLGGEIGVIYSNVKKVSTSVMFSRSSDRGGWDGPDEAGVSVKLKKLEEVSVFRS